MTSVISRKTLSIITLFCLSFISIISLYAGGEDRGALARALQELAYQKRVESQVDDNISGLSLQNGDLVLKLGGSFKTEYDRAHNMTMLNSALPDKQGVFKYRADLNFDLAYGAESYGRPVLELGAKVRQKATAGNHEKTVGTSKSEISLLDAHFGGHSHSINMPLAWLKNLWAKINLNPLWNNGSNLEHSITVGMFDFSLGRGIAYGPFYGSSKEFLGLFTSSNDFSPYGILFSGEILKDKLAYDLYFARLEEKSGSFKQTFAHDSAHIVGRRKEPFSGVDKRNDVYAARVKFNYENDNIGKLNTESYLMFNKADDQSVEMSEDSKSELWTTGWMFEVAKSNVEFGGEVAFNFGHEQLYEIDRNVIRMGVAQGRQMVTAETAFPGLEYSHIVYGAGVDPSLGKKDDPVAVTVINKGIVDGYAGSENNAEIYNAENPTSKDRILVNSGSRYRPAFKNDYRGWMGVLDASYKFPEYNCKASIAAGYASGDVNPHGVEKDKKYKGFVGLHEGYGGKRVTSVFVLNSRKTQRPLSLDDKTGKIVIDNSFTDMIHAGVGFEWDAKKDLNIKTNILSYWKDADSKKYEYTKDVDPAGKDGYSTTVNARKHYGAEGNVMLEYTLARGLRFGAQFAVFVPGSYYTDIKHAPLNIQLRDELDQKDKSGYDQAAERFGDDVAFHFNCGLEYKF